MDLLAAAERELLPNAVWNLCVSFQKKGGWICHPARERAIRELRVLAAEAPSLDEFRHAIWWCPRFGPLVELRAALQFASRRVRSGERPLPSSVQSPLAAVQWAIEMYTAGLLAESPDRLGTPDQAKAPDRRRRDAGSRSTDGSS
jgi:hypothetical protein